MSILCIEQTDDIDIDADAISNTISTTKRGDIVSFDGYYIIDRPIKFIRGRDYRGNYGTTFMAAPEYNGPLIDIVDMPDTEKNRLERLFSRKHALGRVLIWTFHKLHIRIPSSIFTSITCFRFESNGAKTAIAHHSS